MEIHEASRIATDRWIEKAKAEHIAEKKAEPFTDPIREFARASKVESVVRNWLTYPIEERKRIVRSQFAFYPRNMGDPEKGQAAETENAFQSRQMERWRALCVVIQEESRAKAGNRSPEVATAALKQLFPEHDWKTPVTPAPAA